jgi:MFS family permease
MGKLDWKWIGIGVLIMIALNLIANFALALILAPQFRDVDPSQITLSGGQMALSVAVIILAFLIGGFIVGAKSAGRTIFEPGLSALIAVVIGLAISGNVSVRNLVVGGLVPLIAGAVGGWLGERRQQGKAA